MPVIPLDLDAESIIEVDDLVVNYGKQPILQKLDLQVKRGEVLAIVGGSGSGKTTLLRCLLMLQHFSAGSIKVFGQALADSNYPTRQAIRHHWGVMFQHSALFSALRVIENVKFPLQRIPDLSEQMIDEIALLKLAMVGLPMDAVCQYPSELSGGMQRRVALARAIACDPTLLLLDEPTTGLDPHSASALDDLVLHLRDSLGITVVMISHDLDTLWRVTDRVAFLGRGRILALDTMQNLVTNPDPMIREYFAGARGMKRTPA